MIIELIIKHKYIRILAETTGEHSGDLSLDFKAEMSVSRARYSKTEWLMPIIPELERLRQKDQDFKGSLRTILFETNIARSRQIGLHKA